MQINAYQQLVVNHGSFFDCNKLKALETMVYNFKEHQQIDTHRDLLLKINSMLCMPSCNHFMNILSKLSLTIQHAVRKWCYGGHHTGVEGQTWCTIIHNSVAGVSQGNDCNDLHLIC